jgi:hypothetical protein
VFVNPVLPAYVLPFIVTLETYSQQKLVGLLAHKGDWANKSVVKNNNMINNHLIILT